MSKHTKGPWKLTTAPDAFLSGKNSITDSEGTTICRLNVMSNTGKDVLSDVGLANARLIAAAPEMLLALKQTEVMLADWARKDPSCEFLLTLIRPVIAKAEGEE